MKTTIGGERLLKKSFLMASATVISRILGLIRVIFSAHILGGGMLASVWFYTFMIPNLFRRLLGEGALGTSLVPIISYTNDKISRDSARRKLSVILAFLSLVLAGICILTVLVCYGLYPFIEDEQVRLILETVPAIIPYTFFICMIGAISAVLNSFNLFFLPAVGALFLNLSLILTYIFVCPGYSGSPHGVLYSLSGAVLTAGILQFLMVLYLLKKVGMFPDMGAVIRGENRLRQLAVIRELWKLMIPGLIGAGAVQISMFLDKSLALFLGDKALPALTYSDRIVYLPIGIFAVSFGTVALSQMSHLAAKKNYAELGTTLVDGLKYLMIICLPITVFVVIFRELIIRLLFLHGEFDLSALKETAYAMFFYAMGIPAFAAVKIIVSAFHSRKDMKTPVRISILCLGVNLCCSLILMFPMRQGGLALATVISSLLNNFLLLRCLRKEISIELRCLLKTSLFSLIFSVAAAFVSSLVLAGLGEWRLPVVFVKEFLPMILTLGTFLITYFLLMLLFNPDEIRSIAGVLLRRKQKQIKSE